MVIDDYRSDLAKRNLRGLPFILASILLWIGIFFVWYLSIENVLTRNLYTFFCTAPLMPVAYLFSKIIKAEFSAKDNPLNNLGILFSMNQFLYILIAMWAFSAAPSKMVMLIGMIYGAHLFPFSWLYKSKAYLVMSIIIPLVMLSVGYNLPVEQVFILPIIAVVLNSVFATWLVVENRNLDLQANVSA